MVPRRILEAFTIAVFWAQSAQSATAALPIENKPVSPQIHPIAPEDGATAVTNPPAMVFWPTGAAAEYGVELSQSKSFGRGSILARGIALPFYNHTDALAPGTWYWRYYYVTKDGKRSAFSPVRRFTVDNTSIPFPVPPVAEILDRLPGHPRIYCTADTLAAFQARKDKEAATIFAHMVRSAERVMASPPKPPKLGGEKPANMKKRGVAFWRQDGKWLVSLSAGPGTLEGESNRTRDLAMLYLITGEPKYADAAKQRLLWQANFRLDLHQDDPAHHDTVHTYEYGLQRMAAAYDCIYDALSPAERKQVLDAVEYHGDACYRKLRFRRRIHLKYETSHAQQDMHELLTTALAVAKDLPAATTWLEYLIPQYVNRLAWGKNDGGYSEGHYYNYKWHGMVRCAVSLRNAAGLDLFKKPRLVNAGRFWLYGMSLNYWWAHFGDTFSLHTPLSGSSNDRDGANFLASVYRDRYVKWWADQIDARLQNPLWYLSDETLRPKPPVDIPQAAMYPDVGWMATYDEFWRHDSTRLFFKSSPWGSHSHAHEDQNSFVIHAFGEILAIDKGYYGYYGDKYHMKICRASKSHNTILVDGEGQGRGIQYNGRIVDFFDGKAASFVMGDATAAYGGKLKTFLRAVLFIRPNYFIIYDQLESDEQRQFSWQVNALHPMRLDAANQSVAIVENGVELKATHLLPRNMGYRQDHKRGFELKSRYSEAFPEMWTCWAEPAAKSKDLRVLTVMEAYRQADGPKLTDLQLVEGTGLVGAGFRIDGEGYLVLFQRDMANPSTSQAGPIESDATCVVVAGRAWLGRGSGHYVLVNGSVLKVGPQVLHKGPRPVSIDSEAKPMDPSRPAGVNLRVYDSAGTYDIKLEGAANAWGDLFYFVNLDPREPGKYEIGVANAAAEVFVEDKRDPERSSRGNVVEMREDGMLILKTSRALLAGAVQAKLCESYKGRILNLVRNGDFETGSEGFVPRGWWLRHYSTNDLSYGYWSDEKPARGKRCLKLFRNKSKIRVYSQWIEVTKPGRYVLRFKAKATCKGGIVNTSWSRQSLTVRVAQSDEWQEYRAERDMTPHMANIHVIFDQAEGPDQTLWVDDLEFGQVAE